MHTYKNIYFLQGDISMDLQKRLVGITLEEKSGQHKNPCCRIITTTGVLLSIVRFYWTCSHTDKGIFMRICVGIL